jgi:hypothetical protein
MRGGRGGGDFRFARPPRRQEGFRMKHLLLALLLVAAATAAEKAPDSELVFPLPELRLVNGTVFRNVTVVRFESDRVVLKSSAGVGPLSYAMIAEPMRAKFHVAKAAALAKAQAEAAKLRADHDANIKLEQSAIAAREARKARIEEAISKRSLVVGMTPEEAVKAWGEPEKKNRSGGAYGATEQWIYGRGQARTYVYFRDGSLTSWQN